VTGGEPFIREDMPALVAELGRRRPTVVLSNGTLFNGRRLRALEPLADLPVHVQISLDHPDPVDNDAMRGPENFRKVLAGDPAARGARDRGEIATTLEDPDAVDPDERERLCELHRSLGIPDEDHVVRRSSTGGGRPRTSWGCRRLRAARPGADADRGRRVLQPVRPDGARRAAGHRPARVAHDRAAAAPGRGVAADRRPAARGP
jgi:MoaA/NifB/PqqE/SkfB family radical SAM enzyme